MRRMWTWVLWLLWCASEPLRSTTGAIISPTFGEMRGKLAGNVFSRNKGGPYVKMHATPTNPNSSRQQTTRENLAYCAQYWGGTLNPTERGQWVAYAQANPWLNSLGQSILLTGLDWFTMVNSRLRDAGLTLIAAPTALAVPGGFATMTGGFASGTTIDLTFTPALPANFTAFVWGTGAIGPGRDPNFRQCVLIGYSPADQASPWTATLPWSVASGMNLKIYGGIMSDEGRVSVMLDHIFTQV